MKLTSLVCTVLCLVGFAGCLGTGCQVSDPEKVWIVQQSAQQMFDKAGLEFDAHKVTVLYDPLRRKTSWSLFPNSVLFGTGFVETYDSTNLSERWHVGHEFRHAWQNHEMTLVDWISAYLTKADEYEADADAFANKYQGSGVVGPD